MCSVQPRGHLPGFTAVEQLALSFQKGSFMRYTLIDLSLDGAIHDSRRIYHI